MKKLLAIIAVFTFALNLSAQTIITACEDAKEVITELGSEINEGLSAGEHWFTAQTSALPLTLTFYPDDEKAAAPIITLDLTCQYDEEGNGIYDDPQVANMITFAGNYGLSFPMQSTLKQQTDNKGRIYYDILFDRNYRDMLFDHGVTYAIPAYVKLTITSSGTVNIVSSSINTRCHDYVNDLVMNSTMLIEPDDSVNVYRWQIGEWIDKRYRITWDGEDKLDFYTGKDCELTRSIRVRDHYIMPDEYIQMTPTLAQEWIKDIYATEMYVKLYPKSSGILTVNEYELVSKIVSFTLNIENELISAEVDNENYRITAKVPRGVGPLATSPALLKSYIGDADVVYIIDNVEKSGKLNDVRGDLAYDNNYTNFIFRGNKYILDIDYASVTGNTNSNLASITIDGQPFADFDAGVVEYNDIEVASELPIVNATAANENSQVSITQADGVPGTAIITVTAEAGNTTTYTINFIKQRSRNTRLSSITVDGEPLENFDASTLNYRMYAQSIPVVAATVEDPKSKLDIVQAKSIPGSAQIIVTSEAQTRATYGISFVLDPELEACKNNAIMMSLNNNPVVVNTDGSQVLRAPFAKPTLEGEISNWAGQRIAFYWSGDNDIIVYVGSSCLFDPAVKNNAFIDSVIISESKGEERHIAYLTEKQTKEWGQRSIDGTLYLKVKTGKAGTLVAQTWTPNGNNNSTLIDINQEYYFPTGHTSDNLYKIYLPDWQKKKVKFSWEGMEKMTMYGAAKWEFRLTQGDPAMLRPDFPHQFSASDSWEWDEEDISVLTGHNYMLGGGDFIYIRFITDGFAGTLETTQTGGEVTRSEYVEYESTTLSWQRVEDNILIHTTVPQQVNIFSLQGALITSQYLTPDAEIVLPRALYIVQGENETGKAW